MLDRSSHANKRSWVNLHQRSSSDLLRRFSFSDFHHQAIFISNFRFSISKYPAVIFINDLRQIFNSDFHRHAIFTVDLHRLHRRFSLNLHQRTFVSVHYQIFLDQLSCSFIFISIFVSELHKHSSSTILLAVYQRRSNRNPLSPSITILVIVIDHRFCSFFYNVDDKL